MNKPNNYWTVKLVDGSLIDFDRLCTTIEDFNDSYSYVFKSKNFNTGKEIPLMIIPKNQISKITNEYNPDEIGNVWREEYD